MALLRMLNRAAFICNVCFLLAFGFMHYKGFVRQDLTSLIIIMGIFMSIILNIVVMVWQLVLFLIKKPGTGLSKPLVLLNAGFLSIQLFLLVKSIYP